MEDIEVMFKGAAVEGDNFYKVLDEGKLRGEVGQRNHAEVLVLI
jgi:hypothetical protein